MRRNFKVAWKILFTVPFQIRVKAVEQGVNYAAEYLFKAKRYTIEL